MKKWTDLLLERLDTAYRARFDRDAALIFLNDAYQEYLLLRTSQETLDVREEKIVEEFMEIRDSFIYQLVDRYPSNYSDVEKKINQLKQLCAGTSGNTTDEFSLHLHPAF